MRAESLVSAYQQSKRLDVKAGEKMGAINRGIVFKVLQKPILDPRVQFLSSR